MQSQAWRPLGVVWRPPTPAIVFLAAAVSALLLHSYGLRIAAGAFTTAVALDCIRIPRKRTTIPQQPVPEINGTILTKRLQRERHNY
ncbi:hypothetical protein [Streptomyces griseofuscus]|uniref:hypothetical protein n=1 Tax=Streptomyces griseofuscus TaxID=146922 RepID=UPI0033FEA95C